MSEITVSQAWESVELELNNGEAEDTESRANVFYIVSGTDDEASACESAWEESPEDYIGIPRLSIAVAERLSETMWKIEVRYGYKNSSGNGGGSGSEDDEDEPTLSFDCGGGTRRVLYSLNQRQVYGDPREAGGAVGWNGKTGSEMEIAGVDVPTAQMRETYTRQIKFSELTTAYRRNLAKLVGKVNSDSFKGWEPGEIMFTGASFTSPVKRSEKVTVAFHFSINVNEKNAKLNGITIGDKKGWEYIWAISKSIIDKVTKKPKIDIAAAYIDQVCEETNFSVLGL